MEKKHLKSELDFYQRAYQENQTRWERGFLWGYSPNPNLSFLIDKHVKEKERTIDLGCGDGRHIDLLLKKGFKEIVGVDFCPEAIDLCKRQFGAKLQIVEADLTIPKILSEIGLFDLVVDWSVLDHIRREYLSDYLATTFNLIKEGGILISTQFADTIPGLRKNQNYRLNTLGHKGHYSRGFDILTLKQMYSPLKLIDSSGPQYEDGQRKYQFVTVVLRKNTLTRL